MLYPGRWHDIELSFETDWFFPRVAEGSCWLNLPSLMGANAAVDTANEAIGHSNWAEDQHGQPLYAASNYLHEPQSDVRLDASNSIPLPSELIGLLLEVGHLVFQIGRFAPRTR
jgi:hypothetical protein